MNRKRPKTCGTAIDLFSGCGGLTEGLRQAGFKVVAAVEMNPLAVKTYSANHKRVKMIPLDIHKVSPKKLIRELGLRRSQLDLLAGCPPCQGFSTLRTLNGGKKIEDERNDLVYQFFKFVRVLRPKTVMMENVPGLMTDGRFDRFIKRLKKLGYKDPKFGIFNAKDYGVPQRRRRLIMMASRIGKIRLPNKVDEPATVRQFIDGLPGAGTSGDPAHDIPENRTKKVRTKIARIPKNGGSRADLPRRWQLGCHKRCDGFKDVYGRIAWDKVAPTITGGCFNPSKGRFLHPEENRCITMREAALLQTFPRDYRFPDVSSKQGVALMIGNALPPEMIRRFALSLRKPLRKRRKAPSVAGGGGRD